MGVVPDFRLVAGFDYRCLPGCGLCCYTTPAVAPPERARLIQLDPAVPLRETSGGWAQIDSRPEGGACHFLRHERCTAHAVRPATCGEFPLTAYVSDRVQVSVVLSCPGVDLARLGGSGPKSRPGEIPPALLPEAEYVRREVAQAEATGQLRWASQRRAHVVRRLTREGVWETEEEVRQELRGRLEDMAPTELYDDAAPSEEEPLEALPLFYDPAFGRVAWRPHAGGTEFLTLSEAGGTDQPVAVLASPSRSPGLDAGARRLLQGYLGYVLARDATIGAAYDFLLANDPALPHEVVDEDLREVAGQVVRLAVLRRALTSDTRGPLSARDIENGIRATDMDVLDRPTGGLRL